MLEGGGEDEAGIVREREGWWGDGGRERGERGLVMVAMMPFLVLFFVTDGLFSGRLCGPWWGLWAGVDVRRVVGSREVVVAVVIVVVFS